MPSERVKEALERIRREKLQNSETPQLINAYNLDAQNETIDKFANSPLFTQEPLQPRPQTSDAVGLLKSAGKSLYAGVYGFADSGLLGIPSLAEAAIDRYTGVDIGFEDLAEQFREESSVAQVAGGIGTGAGYLAGLPVKGTLKLAQKIGIPSAIIRGFSKQSLSRADKVTRGIAKKGGLDKKVVNDFSQKLKGETRKFISKGDKVKFTVKFKGREMQHTELGKDLMNRIIEETKDIAKVESQPKFEGKQMVMIIQPI